jgi:hypothetical protein
VLLYFGLQCVLLAIRHYHGADLPATLKNSENSRFVFRSRSRYPAAALGNVHVSRLPADEGFIDLDMPRQLLERSMMQSEANAVRHVPR